MDSRLEDINNLLIRYSLGDFDYSIQPSDKYDEIDAFITNINMLGEELKTSVISRDYFNNIFHSVSDMLFVIDNKGEIISINKAVTDTLKYSENQLRETSINFIAGDDSRLFEYVRSMLSKNGVLNNLEVVLNTLELNSMPVSLSCSYLYNQHQVRIGYLIIARDLSKIKEFENSSKETEKKFRKVFEDSSDCFFITDAEGKFMELNHAGFELLKCTEAGIGKDSFFGYIYDDVEREAFINQIKEQGVVPDCKLKIRDKENTIIDCLVSANKITNEFGEIRGFQGTIKNMTKQKEIENLFVRTIVDTQEKERNRIVKDLHDSLGQQLSAIKFFLGTLKNIKGKVSSEKYDELLIKSDTALNEVIVELSNICFNIMPGTLQKFGLNHAINELCNKIKLSNTIDFKTEIASDFPVLDKNLEVTIFRIVQEFINNAIKHGFTKKINIKMISDPEEGKLFIVLKDAGKGFDIRKVEEFKGMGLKNVKSRIESYTGIAKISSSVGVGTMYEIMIPYKAYLPK
jgi:PAS domain S-box-containing protein